MYIGPKWRTALISLLAISSAAGITVYVNVVSRIDPFANMRGPAGSSNPIEIEFRDVAMKHWQRGKLVTSGQIGRIDVHRDHQQFDLYNVTNGVYHTTEGTFRYAGTHARWLANAESLQADGGVHVIGKEFDLRAPSFKTDHVAHTITVHGPANGTLSGGEATVSDVVYNLANHTYETGDISWTGKLAINLQQPDKSGPPSQGGQTDENAVRVWHVDSKHSKTDAQNHHLTHYVLMRATDGDSIVQSPNGAYDNSTAILTCEGPVKYWGVKANIVCDHLVVDRRHKIATATGNVVIYIKPEAQQTAPDDKMEVPPFTPEAPDAISKDRPPPPMATDKESKKLDEDLRSSDTFKRYPATVRADKIVYYYEKGQRHAVITGSPQAQQELPGGRWRMVWTNHAYYDGEKDTLTLFSAPGKLDTRMKNSIGDDGTAAWYSLSTKDGDDSYEAENEKAIVVSLDEEANSEAAKAGKAKTKEPAKPTKNPTTLQGPIGRRGP